MVGTNRLVVPFVVASVDAPVHAFVVAPVVAVLSLVVSMLELVARDAVTAVLRCVLVWAGATFDGAELPLMSLQSCGDTALKVASVTVPLQPPFPQHIHSFDEFSNSM